MKLENTFTVAAPLDAVWEAFKDPETVAPCFPGATLTEYTGDSFTGVVKVKLGPISMSYNGKGIYLERDDATHRLVIDASGRDSKGNGTASAKVTGQLTSVGADKTEVTMVTDMNITGKAAQFGGGMITEVADRIIGMFSERLAASLASPDDTAAPSGVQTRPKAAAKANNDEAIDLLGSGLGGPIARAAIPAAALGLLAVIIAVIVTRSRTAH